MARWLSKKRRHFVEYLLTRTKQSGGLDKVAESIARGDIVEQDEQSFALRWLERERKKEVRAWRETPAGVASRQARAAEHSAIAAYFALVISALALVVAVLAYIRP